MFGCHAGVYPQVGDIFTFTVKIKDCQMIRHIDHLNIVVSDLEESVQFFKLLGFCEGISSELDSSFLEKVTGIQGASGRFTELRHPGSDMSIELLKFNAGSLNTNDIGIADRIGLRHLAFSVTDIESEVQRLQDQGVKFIGTIQTWEKTGKKLIYFHGPDGILLEFAQYLE